MSLWDGRENQVNQAETNANPFSAPPTDGLIPVAVGLWALGEAALAAEEERMQSGCPAGAPQSPVCIQGYPAPPLSGMEPRTQPQQRTGRQVTHRERKAFIKARNAFLSSVRHQPNTAGVCSPRCMGDAWSAGSLLRAQVRQQGLSWQQPGSTIRPGPGPGRDHLTSSEAAPGQSAVRLSSSQTPGSSAQLSPGLLLALSRSLAICSYRKEERPLGTLLWASRGWSEGTNSAGLRVLSSGPAGL